MRSAWRLSVLSLYLLLAGGCAALPPTGKPEPRDPWERMNRATYRFNDALDRAVLKPVARGYRKVTPHVAQTGVSHFFDNVEYPIVMLNDLLQGEFRPFISDTGRLLLNTTVGIGGLFDPATAAGLEKNDRDFGQTLGKWGLGSGPYFVIPILGPCDLRDTFGRTVDAFASPPDYLHNLYWRYGLWGLRNVVRRADLLDAERALEGVYDPYAFVRNVYLQHRDFKVNGGESAGEEKRELQLLEEAGPDEEPAPAAPRQVPPPQTPSPQTPPPQSAVPETAPPH
jgi:phospholipid-binding lipoprotein MlaA